jgi:hypothetical protein
MHFSQLSKVVIDVPESVHDREVAFWAGAIGVPMNHFEKYPEYHGADLPGQEFGLLIQRLTAGEPRVHVDVHTDDVEAEVARLELLGATRVQQAHAWWIMKDPAGLVFCVIPTPPGHLNEENATRWP